jgi:hypothetical protein
VIAPMPTAMPQRTAFLVARVWVVRAAVAAALVLGVASAVRDDFGLLASTSPDVHRIAWTGSAEDRLRLALTGWYPTVQAVRQNTPETAVIWGWSGLREPPQGWEPTLSLFAVLLAPRLVIPMEPKEWAAGWRARMGASGMASYLLDLHPAFAPEPPTRSASTVFPEVATSTLVQAGPDFTLFRLDSRR